jgi:excisionase family DNA binding protein
MMTPKQAALMLGVTERKLQCMRSDGSGPRYHRLGHRTVRYMKDDILEWLRTRAEPNEDEG